MESKPGPGLGLRAKLEVYGPVCRLHYRSEQGTDAVLFLLHGISMVLFYIFPLFEPMFSILG